MSISSLAYIANIRFPTEKAHGYQIARVTTALSTSGVAVTLYVPRRRNHLTVDWPVYYGVPNNSTVVRVPCIDVMTGNVFLDRIAFVIQMMSFAFCLLFVRIPKNTVVMTRDKGLAWFFGLRGFTVFFNAHSVNSARLTRFSLSRVAGVVCNSEGTASALKALLTIPTAVIPNGADSNPYIDVPIAELRKELELPEDKTIVLYSGHLYAWKGADTIVGAAECLREDTRFLFVCIGGVLDDVAKYKNKVTEKQLSNILFLGHKSKSIVPKYLCAADVLLLPNTAHTEESRTQTSPLKLFEYLAARRAIIASDLPSLRSIVSENEVLFVKQDDEAALAFGLQYITEHPEETLKRCHSAYELSKKYTWEAHVASLSHFVEETVTERINVV